MTHDWNQFLDIYSTVRPDHETPDFDLEIKDPSTSKGSSVKAAFVWYLTRLGVSCRDIGVMAYCSMMYVTQTNAHVRAAIDAQERSRKADIELLNAIEDHFDAS